MLDNRRLQPQCTGNCLSGVTTLEVGRWYPVCECSLAIAPPKIGPWITECHSMTKTLEASFDGTVEVQVLSERLDAVFADEQLALGNADPMARIREVLLKIGDGAVVTARTVIPAETFEEMYSTFTELGTRPLGHVLFELEAVRRLTADLALLDFSFPLLAHVRDVCGYRDPDLRFWGRRNLFSLGGFPLLLTEIFLPPAFDPENAIPDPVIRSDFQRPIPLRRS
jgi:chorismate lyase